MAERYPSAWGLREAQLTGTTAAVFMTFVAVGCAYIVLAKLAGVDQFYVTFVPVATMIGYALLIYLARSLRLRDDQSGDNLYYMGFLFTLTSLGVSLYQFSATRSAEEIVQNFGIAIASTIAGIGLRVVFNQMRRDPIEVERMMRLELAEAARRVRRELDSTVVEFGHHRRSAQQAATDSFIHVTEKLDELTGAFLARLDGLSERLAAPLEAASRRAAEALMESTRAISVQLSESTSRLAAASQILSERAGGISSALEVTAAKLAELQTPDRMIEVRLEPVAQSLVEAADRLAAQAEGQATRVEAALTTANAAMQRSLDLIAIVRGEFDGAASMNRNSLDAARNMMQGMVDALEEFKSRSKAYTEVLQFMLDKTDATMRVFTDVLIKSGIDAAAQSDGLRDVLPALEASVQSLAAAGERISGAMDDLRSVRRLPKRETID